MATEPDDWSEAGKMAAWLLLAVLLCIILAFFALVFVCDAPAVIQSLDQWGGP